MPLTRIAAAPRKLFLDFTGLRGNEPGTAHSGLLEADSYSFSTSGKMSAGSFVTGYANEQLTLHFATDEGLTWFLNKALTGTNFVGSIFGGDNFGLEPSYADSLTLSLSQARVTSVSDSAIGGFTATLAFSVFDYQARDLQANALLAPANRFGSNNVGTDTVLSPASPTLAPLTGHTGVPTHFYFTASGLTGPISGGGLSNLFAASFGGLNINNSTGSRPTVDSLTVTLLDGENGIDGILSRMANHTAISTADLLGYSAEGQVYKLSISNAHITTADLSVPGQVTVTLDFTAATWRTVDVDAAGAPIRFDSVTANLSTALYETGGGALSTIPADFVPVESLVSTPNRFFLSVAGWTGETPSGLHAGLFEAASVALPTFSNAGVHPTLNDIAITFNTQDGAARFFDALATNAALPAVTVYETSIVSSGQADVMQFDLAGAHVTSVQTEGGRTQVTLGRYTAFEATTYPRDAAGNLLSPVHYGYDSVTALAATVADAPVSNAVAAGDSDAPLAYYITIAGITGNHPLQFQSAGTLNALGVSAFSFFGSNSGTVNSDFSDVLVILPEGALYQPALTNLVAGGYTLTGAKIFGYSAQGLAYELDLSTILLKSVTASDNGSVQLTLRPTQYAVHVFDYGSNGPAVLDEKSGYNKTGAVVTPYAEVTPADQSAYVVVAPAVVPATPSSYYLAVGGWTGDSDSSLHPGLLQISNSAALSVQTTGNGSIIGKTVASDVTVQFTSYDGLANFIGALASNTHLAQAGIIGAGFFGGATEQDSYRLALNKFTVSSVSITSGGYTATLNFESYDVLTRGLAADGTLTAKTESGYNLATQTRDAPAISATLNSQPTDGSNNAMPTSYFLQLPGVTGTFATTDTSGLLPIASYSFGLQRPGSATTGGGTVYPVSGGTLSIALNSSNAADPDLLRLLTDATLIGQAHIYGYNATGRVFDLALSSSHVSSIQTASGGVSFLSLEAGSFTASTVDVTVGGVPVRAQTAGYNFTTATASAFTQTAISSVPVPTGTLNTAPTALADSYAIDGVAIVAAANGVLANDNDPDGNALFVPLVTSAPGHGTLTLRADGGFDYSANALFSGSDSFSYQASDAFGAKSAVVVAALTVYLPGATSGDDTITGTPQDDLIRGLGGNDILSGGGGADTIDGGTGVNALYGGAGNDRLIVGAGADGTIVDGGADTDTLVVTGSVSLGGLTGVEAIELQSDAALTLTGAQFTNGLAANATLSGTGSLTINMGATDSELYLQQLVTAGGSSVAITVNGSANNDVIKGAIGSANTINGGSGNDSLRGGAKVDTLNGGDGNDKIEGGQGADILTGGPGADVFRYQSANASGIGAAADRITDFVSGTDKLGFLLLDSDPNTVGIQGFSYIDTQAFHGTGTAEVRYGTSGADLLVQLDLNGDAVADMEILLQGLGGQSLTSGDFLLNPPAGAQTIFFDSQQRDVPQLLSLPSAVIGEGVYTDTTALARFDSGSGQFVDETAGNHWADFGYRHSLFENHVPTGSEFLL